uniref:Uncharacterized protein n=1 Tax=Methylophaga nitratireducenticrescens TaxID=754476 RepID=I1XG21_METNJ
MQYLSQTLRKISIGTAMQRNLGILNQQLNCELTSHAIENNPE